MSVATSATVPPSTSSPAIAAEVTVSGFGEQVGRRPESVQASLKADDSAVRNARAPSTDNSDGTQAQLVVHLPPESELKEEPPIEEVPPECESLEWRLDTEEQIARARYEPKDMHWYPERTCLPIVDVNVSSADSLHEAANVTDRDLRTRWQPGRVNDDEWLVVDLGSVCHVSGISLVWYIWESGEGTIEVETSIDGEAFRSCDRMTSVKRGMQQALRTFLPAPARYLRVRSTSGESPLAFSILEVGVHGEARGLAAREQE